MIDPGHPFTKPYADLIASLEDSLRNGVQRPNRVRLAFSNIVSTYDLPLEPAEIAAITRVSGLLAGRPTTFMPGIDYQPIDARITWIGTQPDADSLFEVEYLSTSRATPAGLTDFNPGSVTGTLVRAVARELTLLYQQVDEAYRRAFIDLATDVALDNVVALLGVTRNPALKASGHVTFFRNSPADWTYVIPLGTRVADTGGQIFVTTQEGAIPQQLDEFGEQSDGIVKTNNRIAALVGIWPQGGNPDPKTSLKTIDTAPQKPFGDDQRTITLAEGVRPQGELRITYKPKSVRVPVEAAEPGPQGNADTGTVVIMPTPPTGVGGVVNEAPIDGGQDAEPDDQLRERARHALERAGNATLNALKFAVLDVDGVTGADVLDHSVDESVPLGQVRVRYATAGGDEQRQDQIKNQLLKVVDDTRAAGILVNLETITPITISGVIYAIPASDVHPDAPNLFRQAIIAAIAALEVGQPLSVRRLSALVYQVAGLADVAEAQLSYTKRDPHNQVTTGSVPDLMTITRAEQFQPDAGNLKVIVLSQLAVHTIRPTGTTNEIDVKLESSQGAANFKSLSLDVNVTIQATLKRAPEQPAEVVGRFTRAVQFVGANFATLTIALGDMPNFRQDDHAPDSLRVTIAATAYAGLGSATATIAVSV